MFHGSLVALVTPMQNDQIDEERLRELVEHHIVTGTHGIVAAGTTGESGTLSHEEKLHVIRIVVEQAKERIPVIAGTAVNETKACIQLTCEAMACGVDAALIMTPAYIKPTQEGLYQHYHHIAEGVALPIILYNVPGRTACDLLPETVAKLSKKSNIVGLKEATPDLSRLQELLAKCEGNIDIYSGEDASAAQWMLAGAKGVISVTANVDPKRMAKMCDAAQDADTATCLKLNEELDVLHELLFVESNPIPVKWALSKMGFINDEIRLPLTSLSAKHHGALEQALKNLQLI